MQISLVNPFSSLRVKRTWEKSLICLLKNSPIKMILKNNQDNRRWLQWRKQFFIQARMSSETSSFLINRHWFFSWRYYNTTCIYGSKTGGLLLKVQTTNMETNRLLDGFTRATRLQPSNLDVPPWIPCWEKLGENKTAIHTGQPNGCLLWSGRTVEFFPLTSGRDRIYLTGDRLKTVVYCHPFATTSICEPFC